MEMRLEICSLFLGPPEFLLNLDGVPIYFSICVRLVSYFEKHSHAVSMIDTPVWSCTTNIYYIPVRGDIHIHVFM